MPPGTSSLATGQSCFDIMKISLIIACVLNLRVGQQPFPAIYPYVFPSSSSKFTQLLAALVDNINHILK